MSMTPDMKRRADNLKARLGDENSSPSGSTGSIDHEPATEHDYPEDWPHENGQYTNYCKGCGTMFIGHKRRVLCKVCAGQ